MNENGLKNRLQARPVALLALGLLFFAGIFTWVYVWRSDDAIGVLQANGRVEGDQVAVGAKVGGRIVRLPVREGHTLTAGELIAELSSQQAKALLERAEHDLHTAREELSQSQAQLAVLKREIEVAEAALQLAKQESQARIGEAEAALGTARAHLDHVAAERESAEKDYRRSKELLNKALIAPQELDHAKASFETAKSLEEATRQQIAQAEQNLKLAHTTEVTIELRTKEVERSQERLREADAALEVARARVQSMEASLKLAEANVMDTRIDAPFNGTVLRKLVEEGQVVAAGTPLVTFVDLTNLHVKVYLPERDLGKVKLGDPARVYVDAFPERYFSAKVIEVSQEAEFTPRDVHMKDERAKTVFALKLGLENPEGFLKPGMPADARIQWQPGAPWGDGLD